MKRYKVAIVGAGIGASHLQAYLQLPDKFEVTCLCDLDTKRASQALQGHPAIAHTTDLGAVLASADIELVDICLPPQLHYQACSDVLAAGKHAVCEKPLTASVSEAEQLKQQAQHAGRQVFPVFQYRYGPGASQLLALIKAGLTGKAYVASLETHWHRDSDYYAVDWRGTWAGELGGAIVSHAIHIHDWLSFALGPVAQVYAQLGTRVNAIEVEDCAALSLQMTSGALATSSVTLGAAGDTSRLRFCFEKLTAASGTTAYQFADDNWSFSARAPHPQAAVDACVAAVPEALAGFAGLFDSIYHCLEGLPHHAVTIDDAIASVGLASAIYHAARTQTPQQLPLGPDHPLYQGWLPES